MYKLGKLPASHDPGLFKFTSFFNRSYLPQAPDTFWWRRNYFKGWDMFDNDTVGNCVFAGAANETMHTFKEINRDLKITTENVIADYAAVSGYDGSEPSDVGCDMTESAKYRRNVGIIDAAGERHKIDAFVGLGVGDFEELKLALWLFGSVGIGLRLPKTAMDQAYQSQVWSITEPNPKMLGGHYVSGFAINYRGNIIIETWGKTHEMTREFYQKNSDEAIAFLDLARLQNLLSPEGFDHSRLQGYLNEIGN